MDPPTSTSTEQQPLRQVLLKIQDLLSNEDRERLHFLLGNHVPKQYREDPSLGGTLRVLETLLDREIINEADCHYLIKALKEISCFQAAKQLSDYQQKKSPKTTVANEATFAMIGEMAEDNVKIPAEKPAKQPTDMSVQTTSVPQCSWSVRELILVALLSITLIALLTTIGLALRRPRCPRHPVCSIFNTNLVNNGDAETGPCAMHNGTSSPIGWHFNGSITQIAYENLPVGSLSKESPGPR